jgi:nucleotide-binding universal stress UspA family protein
MKIIVGVDTGEASGAAVAWLIEQPFATDAQITLVTSFDMLMSDPLDDEEALEVRANRIRAALPSATVKTALADGAIPNVIERWAADADLLVIGSNRTHHTGSVLAGALPERLAAATAVPIAIIPDDWDGRAGDVVVGVADDDSSDDAVAFAADLAEREGRALRLVHFWQRPIPPTDPVTLYLGAPADLAAEHHGHLKAVADVVRARHPRLDVIEQSHEGYVPHAFRAPGRSASVIVIGSHRRGLIAGWIVGSVGQRLITDSRCALCVVPLGTYSLRSGALPLPADAQS